MSAATALQLLKQFAAEGKEITEDEDNIIFGDKGTFPKNLPTGLKTTTKTEGCVLREHFLLSVPTMDARAWHTANSQLKCGQVTHCVYFCPLFLFFFLLFFFPPFFLFSLSCGGLSQ